MNKKFLYIVVLIFSCWYANGQNQLGKTDDIARISLTPVIADQAEDFPEAASALLNNKLQQIVVNNGLGSQSVFSRFVITANISLTTKDIIPGPPTMTAISATATFFIIDYETKVVFSTYNLSFKAAGTNLNKAYIDGLKRINVNSNELKNFIETGKNKIVAYYNDQCDFIIQNAMSLVAQQQYEEAIFRLSSIPEVCKDCYMKATNSIGPIYKEYLNHLCNINLAEARAVWVANPNSMGANEIAGLLSNILPDAACYSEAQKLISEIRKKILSDEKRDWDFMLKQWNDNVSLESQRIKAYRDVGVAYGNHQPQQVYHFKGWLW